MLLLKIRISNRAASQMVAFLQMKDKLRPSDFQSFELEWEYMDNTANRDADF